jgi:hypothetical protein
MALGDQYRARAAELTAKAQGEIAPSTRVEYENLALAYLRLAEQADRNSLTDVVYEPPSERPDTPHPPRPPKAAPEE